MSKLRVDATLVGDHNITFETKTPIDEIAAVLDGINWTKVTISRESRNGEAPAVRAPQHNTHNKGYLVVLLRHMLTNPTMTTREINEYLRENIRTKNPRALAAIAPGAAKNGYLTAQVHDLEQGPGRTYTITRKGRKRANDGRLVARKIR